MGNMQKPRGIFDRWAEHIYFDILYTGIKQDTQRNHLYIAIETNDKKNTCGNFIMWRLGGRDFGELTGLMNMVKCHKRSSWVIHGWCFLLAVSSVSLEPEARWLWTKLTIDLVCLRFDCKIYKDFISSIRKVYIVE